MPTYGLEHDYELLGSSTPGDPTPTTHDDTNRLLRDQSRDCDDDLEGRVGASTDRSAGVRCHG